MGVNYRLFFLFTEFEYQFVNTIRSVIKTLTAQVILIIGGPGMRII
jgi:hypothetical protein